MVEFTVKGKAETKGSARAFKCGSRCIITNDNPKCKAWQKKVTIAALQAGVQKQARSQVLITFRIEIPKTYLKKRNAGDPHTMKPDIDKLIRPILDALTGIAYEDDNCVYFVSAKKVWAKENSTEIMIFD